MSELSNRMAIERDFARKLSKLSTRQRQELLRIIGNPPVLSRVTDADWQRWQQEREAEMSLTMLGIWLAAANQHLRQVLPRDIKLSDQQQLDLVRRGTVWAATRAAQTASLSMETSRGILTNGVEAWGERDADRDALAALAVMALGPDRDATTAATETTTAAVNGTWGIEPVVQENGFVLRRRWHTERDGKVCAICRPLDGKWVEFVEDALSHLADPEKYRPIQTIVLNGGPPAHPNCRCWLDVFAEPISRTIRQD